MSLGSGKTGSEMGEEPDNGKVVGPPQNLVPEGAQDRGPVTW